MALVISNRQTTFWDFSSSTETVRVHFLDKQEQAFAFHECDGLRIVTEHPVLLDYMESWESVYVASPASESEALVEHMAAEIAPIVSPWRVSQRYFNDLTDPADVLRNGSGLLMQGPRTIVERACAVLDAAGVRYSRLPGQPPRVPMQALIAGANFVVARQFQTTRAPQSGQAEDDAQLGLTRTSDDPRSSQQMPDEPGIGLGLSILGFFAVLMAALDLVGAPSGGAFRKGAGDALFGFMMVCTGFLFLVSYFHRHRSFLFRAVMWVCNHLSRPRGDDAALLWFAFFVLLGSAGLLIGLGWL